MVMFKSVRNRLFVGMPPNTANVGSAPCMKYMCEVMPVQLPAQQLNWADGPVTLCFTTVPIPGAQPGFVSLGVSAGDGSELPPFGELSQTVPPYGSVFLGSIYVEDPLECMGTAVFLTGSVSESFGSVSYVITGPDGYAQSGDLRYTPEEDGFQGGWGPEEELIPENCMELGVNYCVTFTTTPVGE